MYIASASTSVKFHEFPNTAAAAAHHYQPGSRIEGPIRSISWSKDGNWLAIVPHSGKTEIVTVKNQLKLVHTVHDIAEPTCASFQNLTKKHLAVGTKNCQVLIYDIKSRATKKRFPRTSSVVTHVGFTAKDTHCVAGCANGEVFVYNNVANNVACALKIPKSNSLTVLKTHAQKRHLVLGGSNEGVVVVWDTNTSKSRFCADAHKAPVTCAAFSPVNPSLVISTGLDRQFCIYDVDARERIACVTVDNNLTAVDFVDDATSFATASQNGRVHVYDSRNLNQPVYSFEAHRSAVKHLAFQNGGGGGEDAGGCNTSSLGSSVGEEVKSLDEAAKMQTSDLFGYLAQLPPGNEAGEQPDKRSYVVEDGGDSFMAALDLNSGDSTRPEDSHRDDVAPKVPPSLNLITPNVSKAINEKLNADVEHATSTPKLLPQNFFAGPSPIVTSNCTQVPGVSATTQVQPTATREMIRDVIEQVTAEIVQKEIKNALEEVKSEVTYPIMRSVEQSRRMILDLHMAMIKESIKVENCFNSIRELIGPDARASNDSCLAEENMNLRRKIQLLESQIAGLSACGRGDENGNG
ncbi:uncharacterized protein LOC132707579 [Cylas formicarius]|uniref:uncharacterized protein LOC132707579 n=1 Tax=Cylas formicarius TaxID=197179 RepID=UPI002958A24A|nr:uncharacterized protein LOC132707579 [Cylas formicarius]